MNEANKIIEEIQQIKEQYQAEVSNDRKAWPNAIKDRVSKLFSLRMNGKSIAAATDISYYTILGWRPEGLPDSRGRKPSDGFHSLPVVKEPEIKGEFGFDVIPCRDYQENGAHQQISTLAYNLVRNFQIDVIAPAARSRTSSRTNIFEFDSLKSIRFEMITPAGRLLNVSGTKALRLSQSTMRRKTI